MLKNRPKKIEKTGFYSWKKGHLAKGCQLCVKGQKLVLFITGLCHKHCYFCPISEKKYNKDVIYANELKIKTPKQAVHEARKFRAAGAGITGGDPLMKLKRTIKFIHALKSELGKKFHIHFYTPLELVTLSKLKILHSAGLDEIRFHPSLDSDSLWNKIRLAKEFKYKSRWKIGVEIPLLPDREKEIKKLCDFIENKVDFLNLNELEFSETNSNFLIKKGFKEKAENSFAIAGSESMGLKILEYCRNKPYNIHLCTSKLKDRVQFTNRIKRYAEYNAKPYDKITKDGLLLRGIIHSKNPKKIYAMLIRKHKIPKTLISLKKSHIETSPNLLKKLKKTLKKQEKNIKLEIIELYPTSEHTETESYEI